MTTNPKKNIIRLALFICVIIATSAACRWAAETYFFDKFIYDKNPRYGYFTKGTTAASFGKRAEDLLRLEESQNNQKQGITGVLGETADSRYAVVVIGDSYVWGQGLRNEDRFAYVLEKKLNTIIPSRVMSLGKPGGDVFDYYLFYRDIQIITPNIDLFVFGLTENDLMFNPQSRDEGLKQQLVSRCQNKTALNFYTEGRDDNETYEKTMRESFDESFGNTCVFRQLLPLLPKNNALYLVMEHNKLEAYMRSYVQPFTNEGFSVVDPNYRSTIRPEEYPVSEKESHPSKKMNRAYADALFREIQNTDSFKNKKSAYSLSSR
jgi:lysophospholipase L1-like esterase